MGEMMESPGPGEEPEMMTLSERSPAELVEALQQREEGASDLLAEWFHEPVLRLMGEIARRHNLSHDPEVLAERALHGLGTYLRACPPEEFVDMSARAFRAAALAHVAKVALTPFGAPTTNSAPGRDPLPPCPAYESEMLYLPFERVGEHGYGGDWIGGAGADDGSLWVFLADVTGHGYYAHLLAANLSAVWQTCWDGLPPECDQPIELLHRLHAILEGCLPEGVFVEACLGRLAPDGQAVVASAGGTRLLLREGERREISLHTLRGRWLGLAPPDEADQRTWELAAGDELLLGSDGLFDQLALSGRLGEAGVAALPDGSLLGGVRRAVYAALRESPQRDDISAVALRRRARAEHEEAVRAGARA
jgi:hypothetical protein